LARTKAKLCLKLPILSENNLKRLEEIETIAFIFDKEIGVRHWQWLVSK